MGCWMVRIAVDSTAAACRVWVCNRRCSVFVSARTDGPGREPGQEQPEDADAGHQTGRLERARRA